MPAFSLYSGLLSSGSADYDTAGNTLAWLRTLGNPQPLNGALNSLGDWKMATMLGFLTDSAPVTSPN